MVETSAVLADGSEQNSELHSQPADKADNPQLPVNGFLPSGSSQPGIISTEQLLHNVFGANISCGETQMRNDDGESFSTLPSHSYLKSSSENQSSGVVDYSKYQSVLLTFIYAHLW